MQLVSTEEMRKIDRVAIEQFGIPEMVLMENAGRAVVDFLKANVDDLTAKKTVIVCGTGNNGGDGFVIARYLHEMGVAVKAFRMTDRPMTVSAQKNKEIFEKIGGKLYELNSENDMHLLKVAVNYCDIFIDAMLGIGISRNVEGPIGQIIDVVNRRNCLKIAVDIPSGLNANNGDTWGKCFKADYTITLALPKMGLYLNKGIKYCGRIVVKDIGIPQIVCDTINPMGSLIDETVLAPLVQPRNRTCHKGTFGHILMIGGSMGMSGAITMASKAAARSGVGLISCLVPQAIQQHVAMLLPEAMVVPGIGEHQFCEDDLAVLKSQLNGKRGVVIGPGMGTDGATGEMVKTVLQNAKCPVLIDADGLNAFEVWKDVLAECEATVVLTPHPGEMARLVGKDIGTIQANRPAIAMEFAKQYGVYVVLKGANTVIASPEGAVYVNTIDSPALATGGSGDVLAGIVGALLTQGLQAETACSAGVYLHGAAGVMVAKEIGEFSSIAGDIIDMIPAVLKQYA